MAELSCGCVGMCVSVCVCDSYKLDRGREKKKTNGNKLRPQ